MRLTEIKLDAELWPRGREDKETINRYAELFEELPPIAVQKGTGKLIDGWHRFYAASKLGMTEVQVEEADVPSNLLFAEAVRRNLKHGLPLRKEERDEAILKLNRAEFSERRIADILGCSQFIVNRVLRASKANIPADLYKSLPLVHRVAIADAPPEKQSEIAKTVAEKKLTQKETKTLADAFSQPDVTDADRDAMVHDPLARPYLRDEKGEKIQSLDSATREMDFVSKQAQNKATVRFWKTLQQLHKELSTYQPEEIARGIEGVSLPLALETANSIIAWFEKLKLEGAKLGYWQVSHD